MKQPVQFRRWIQGFLALSIFLALPVLGRAQTVRVNWSKRAQFDKYKTYEWMPSQNPNHPFYRQYVGQYVNYDLKKKGLNEVSASQSPQLLVTYHFVTDQTERQETTGFDDGGWGGWGWGGWGMGDGYDDMTTTNVPVTMGILTVDMIDARTKKIIWRGQATANDIAKSNHGEEKDVAKAINKMLQHFPPK